MKLCECGCGNPAPIASKTMTKRGWIKGEPVRFIQGHSGRMRPSGVIKYHVDENTGCWLWERSKTSLGYGHLTIKNKQVLAHRFVYEKHRGKIPEGMTLDHLCRTPSCVNPEHLEPVPHAENCRRGSRGRLYGCVQEIKKLRASGAKVNDIAIRYGVERHAITSLLNGRAWMDENNSK